MASSRRVRLNNIEMTFEQVKVLGEGTYGIVELWQGLLGGKVIRVAVKRFKVNCKIPKASLI
jgi:hypothetical protein